MNDIKVTSSHNIPNINNLLFGVNKTVGPYEISGWETASMMPNVPYYIINGSGIRPGLGSCGYSKVCSSNLSVSAYKTSGDTYLKSSPNFCRWILKKHPNPNDSNPIQFNDIVTIQLGS